MRERLDKELALQNLSLKNQYCFTLKRQAYNLSCLFQLSKIMFQILDQEWDKNEEQKVLP